MPTKTLLAAPGPTPVPPEVLRALAQPIIYHRAPGFAEVMGDVRCNLRSVFQTAQEVLTLAASGTGAMEAAMVNLCSPGDTVITIEGGKFGERWGEIARSYGLEVVAEKIEYGHACDPQRIKELLQKHPKARLVCVQACETSTGVSHPVRELAAIVRETSEALLVVDGITAVGVYDVPMDQWGVDAVVVGSQKAFMVPPGLAFIALSERAWQAQSKAKLPKYYFDLAREKKGQEKNQTAYTPAVNLVVALQAALRMMLAEGLPNVFARHERLARGTRAAAKALNLTPFTKGPAANGLTALNAPAGLDADLIVKHMRNSLGITIAGGQGSMKGKIFRLSHMGYWHEDDVLAVVSGLEKTLAAVGVKGIESGAGVAAAQRVFAGAL